ncbi:U6 snRNA-associated Sm-like protein LSm1 [Erysiphe neolycopersici]|uniref:U6 snRNA-associated Sm-like protein LSm1 n=1 Tax=Erysiphe neolycopersici TaxID=212602 RepID=A0A420I1E5_9PEZI|nr:U6 snRNA-associated Sm-like protein LSm1 [Erysiphe neolycopersici]
MEHLTLNDTSPRGLGGIQNLAGHPRPQVPQLPPQMFTTAAQLLDMTDRVNWEDYTEKLMVALRDGRKLIGTLRSWDQFGISHKLQANLVLQSTVERIFVPPSSITSASETILRPGLFADIPRGVFLVRGENVLLLGEIDLDKDDDIPPGYEVAHIDVVLKLARERKIYEAEKDKIRIEKLHKIGFEAENPAETSV